MLTPTLSHTASRSWRDLIQAWFPNNDNCQFMYKIPCIPGLASSILQIFPLKDITKERDQKIITNSLKMERTSNSSTLVSNGLVDFCGNIADKRKTGGWKAAPYVIGKASLIRSCPSTRLFKYFMYDLDMVYIDDA